ncbi:hypothetical protein AALB39_26745 [Lachnospiraceae bacterium 54-53]
MSYKLNLNKTKMYSLMCEVSKESQLPPVRKCEFHSSLGVYDMQYLHPATHDRIRVTVMAVLGDTMIRFHNESENLDFLCEHFSFQYLMNHGMVREVS